MRSCLVVFGFLCVACYTSYAQDNEKKTRQIVRQFAEHHFDSAYKMFSEEIREDFSLTKMSMIWMEFERQGGGLKLVGEPRSEFLMGSEAWFTEIQFVKASYDLTMKYDSLGFVTAFRFIMPKPKADYADPAYSKGKVAYTEKKILLQSGTYKLPGIFTLPVVDKPVAVVVMVHGSGPNDKDETNGNYKLFRDLALGLAANGIASLRYDKRTLIYANRSVADMEQFTVKEEVLDDALAAIQMAATQTGVDPKRVFLLGHSQGAMLAPRILQLAPSVKGAIMLGGNARPLQVLLEDQYVYLFAMDTTMKQEEKQEALKELHEKILLLDDTSKLINTSSEDLPLNLPASYWLDLVKYNQVQTALALKQPLLIVNGARDYQVTPKEQEVWKKGLKKKKRVSYLLYPQLNHLFAEGTGKPNPQEYSNTKGNVPIYLINDLVIWINKQK